MGSALINCVFPNIPGRTGVPFSPWDKVVQMGHGRKRTSGVSTNVVTANLMLFGRGTFCVLPLIYVHLPQSARAYLFPNFAAILVIICSEMFIVTACGKAVR